MSPRAAVLLESFGFEDVRDYVEGKQDWLSRGLTVEGDEADKMTVGFMAVDPPLINIGMTPSDAVSLIDHQEGNVGAVISGSGIVLGLLSRAAADNAGADGTIDAVMELGPKTYRADADPADVLDYMERNDTDRVVVSDPEGRLIGLLYRDVVEREVNGSS